MTDASPTADAALDEARALVRRGHIEQAEQRYGEILAARPDEIEALNFVAMCALRRGQSPRAIALLERAQEVRPDAETSKSLGLAYRAVGKLDAARAALEAAVSLDPDYFVARLHLGHVFDQLGDRARAATTFARAIATAQLRGQWLDEASTPPPLLNLVRHAMRASYDARRQAFERALAPARATFGSAALRRVDLALLGVLGDVPIRYPDTRQKPIFFYFPDIPSQPYFDRAQFPWMGELERETDAIRRELVGLLAEDANFEPFLKFRNEDEVGDYLRGSGASPAWNAFFFYRHGERFDANCARCPHTASVIDASPVVRIRDHAPENLFSVLTPGSHILPHRGVTNVRLVTHLPLIVPEDCALVVGGETHAWQEGRTVVFDDTYEHEAWNRSGRTRVVLILDVWNPHLTEAERVAVTDLIESIGDFNRAVERS